jgi:hypothetical protein
LSSQLGRDAPVIVIHSLTHAIAALSAAAEACRPIILASPPDAGIYAGPGWFREVLRAAQEAVPKAQFSAPLDCGDDAGAAMAAIRAGLRAIIFIGRPEVAAQLADIAAGGGATLITRRPAFAHDLGTFFFADHDTLLRRCAEILASTAAFC